MREGDDRFAYFSYKIRLIIDIFIPNRYIGDAIGTCKDLPPGATVKHAAASGRSRANLLHDRVLVSVCAGGQTVVGPGGKGNDTYAWARQGLRPCVRLAARGCCGLRAISGVGQFAQHRLPRVRYSTGTTMRRLLGRPGFFFALGTGGRKVA